MDELRAAVRDLATAPSAESADVLVQLLAKAAPGPELAAFISETLELTAVHVNDSSGTTVRWRLIDRLLGMGFPHALHVTPDDLDYHRDRRAISSQVPAALTMVMALLSSLWSFGFAMLSLAGPYRGGEGLLLTVVLLAVCGHGLAAFASAIKTSRGDHAPLLAPLGWSFFAGLGVIGLAQLLDDNGALIAGILGAPAMLTALLCALTATFAKPQPTEAAAPVHTPEPEAAPAPRANVRA